jgi:hypothetical protein
VQLNKSIKRPESANSGLVLVRQPDDRILFTLPVAENNDRCRLGPIQPIRNIPAAQAQTSNLLR